MKADIKALAERAQSSFFRSAPASPVSNQTKSNQARPENQAKQRSQAMPKNQVTQENQAKQENQATQENQAAPVEWDHLRDDEVLADAYLSGVTVAEMARRSGLSQSYLLERLRDLDLIF